jgi:hypothetical protein
MTGFSPRNLWDTKKVYLAYHQEFEILQQAVAELPDSHSEHSSINLRQAVADLQSGQCPEALLAIPWGHNLKLTEKLKDPKTRLWYAKGWQSVDSDDVSSGAFSASEASAQGAAKEKGVPKRVFGQDPTCPGVAKRRRKPIIEKLNEALVA